MKKSAIIIVFIFLCFAFVGKQDGESLPKKLISKIAKSHSRDSLVNLKKIALTDDFDGDGKLDTINQNVINGNTKKQIDYFLSSQCDSIENYFDSIGAEVILSVKNQKCDTLHLGAGGGLYCLINIGDNNKDSKDEIAIVVDYYNFTNISPCTIYTLCNNKWKALKSFKIHEDAFYYSSEVAPDFKQIKGFLEYRKNNWYYIDYQNWFDAETVKDTILKPLKLKKGC